MKKLLGILSAIGLTATASSTVVSCSINFGGSGNSDSKNNGYKPDSNNGNGDNTNNNGGNGHTDNAPKDNSKIEIQSATFSYDGTTVTFKLSSSLVEDVDNSNFKVTGWYPLRSTTEDAYNVIGKKESSSIKMVFNDAVQFGDTVIVEPKGFENYGSMKIDTSVIGPSYQLGSNGSANATQAHDGGYVFFNNLTISDSESGSIISTQDQAKADIKIKDNDGKDISDDFAITGCLWQNDHELILTMAAKRTFEANETITIIGKGLFEGEVEVNIPKALSKTTQPY